MCGGKPCFEFDNALKPAEALDLLINLPPSSEHVCTTKPIGVKQAATFVVSNRAVC